MKFIEVTVSTTNEAQELVADVMWNYTNYGVAISDALDVKELVENRRETWDYIDEKVLEEMNASVTLVKAYVATDIADKTVPLIEKDLAELRTARRVSSPWAVSNSLKGKLTATTG